jgi:hypothetical protein
MSASRYVIVTGRGRPHEVGLLVWGLVFGVLALLGAPRTLSLSEWPPWAFYIWAVGLIVSGVVGILGCYWRGHIEVGLLYESAGMLIGSGGLLAPMIGAFQISGGKALFTAGLYATWAIMNACRVYQIHRDLQVLRSVEPS